ncbi:tyrosine-protein phosphatase [Virgibacillus dakarensis]|uniref:tyrosine-protein phosphatase n=1 Tax=Virgibacillus dakarensis TaxID=1917889 RepID=UPI000B43CD86|nr:CpsB/CapC family capsule biosynthesis tyrosine phosphatase [Virgibacillus dakarensis]
MIDIHCHILPGIDDGARTTEDSLEMARAAVDQGIRTIIATPHHRNGKYNNVKKQILQDVTELKARLEVEKIPLTILPGQETRLNGDMVTSLQEDEVLPLNNTAYVFIEFPTAHVPRYAKQMLFDLQVAGYKPIIVHPERNREIAEHPSILYEFVRKGALTQVTAASVCGKFGKTVQKLTHNLMEANLTHFIASDAHNTTTRGFAMQEAFREVQTRHGNEAVFMFMENAQLLIDGNTVHRGEPQPVRTKKLFGLF